MANESNQTRIESRSSIVADLESKFRAAKQKMKNADKALPPVSAACRRELRECAHKAWIELEEAKARRASY